MKPSEPDVPTGFAPHTRSSPLTDPWEPLYASIADGIVRIGLRVRLAHCNGRHFLHGGLISSLADNSMGLSIRETSTASGASNSGRGVTLSLHVDYVRRVDIGDWVEFRPTVRKVGRTISLADCVVLANEDNLVARASATFKMTAADSS